MTAIALAHTTCYRLSREAFEKVLGPIEDVWRMEKLRAVPILFSLTQVQLLDMAKCMTTQSFPAGSVIFRKGDPGDRNIPYVNSTNIISAVSFPCCKLPLFSSNSCKLLPVMSGLGVKGAKG